MILDINFNPEDWKKELWIASKIDVGYDEEGNEISIYDEPKPYIFNYQPVTSDSEIAEFGEKVKFMKRLVIPISYKDVFKSFDVAYLDGNTPTNETKNGENANYRLLPPRDGNAIITIYLEKLVGK